METLIIYSVKTLLLPPSSFLLLGIFGLWWVNKRRTISLVAIAFSLVCLYLLSTPILAMRLAASQEIYPAVDDTHLQKKKPQAILVLGGGTQPRAPEYGGQITVNSHTLQRIRYAAHLSKKTNLPILVSGGKVFDRKGPSEAELMADILENEFQIPVRWQENKSRNTAENARFSKTTLDNFGVNRILLVTHSIHMKRAVKQFELVGFDVLPAATVFADNFFTTNILSFIPSAQALATSSMALHEKIGLWWYGIRYR